MAPKLSVSKPPHVGVEPPKARGPLLTPADVARLLKLDNPDGEHARRWVREHVPHVKKIGQRTLRWFEQDVLDWVAERGAA
jgi:hypothetical protein